MKTSLKEGEEILLITRKHILSIWLPIVVTAFSLAIAVIGLAFPLLFILPAISLLWLVYAVLERNNNIWAVTNLRIIDEEGIFSAQSKESPLDKINNVTYTASIWGRIFGFGNVEIQTAAETGSTIYEMVESPRKLKDTITQAQEDYKSMHSRRQAREMAESISAQIGHSGSSVSIASELEKLAELLKNGHISQEEFDAAKKKVLGNGQ